jgi:hypothetical protein
MPSSKRGKNALRTRKKCQHIDRNVSACQGDHVPEAAIEFAGPKTNKAG